MTVVTGTCALVTIVALWGLHFAACCTCCRRRFTCGRSLALGSLPRLAALAALAVAGGLSQS